jgi:hypothetical protein
MAEIEFPREFRSGDVYSMIVFDLDYEDLEYGYRFDGPWDPDGGQRFDRTKILFDPYSKVLGGREVWPKEPNQNDSYPYRSRLVFDVPPIVQQLFSGLGMPTVLHGYEKVGLKGDIAIEALQQRGQLMIRLLDHGRTYAPDQVPNPDLGNPLNQQSGGWGLFLSKTGVDQFDYTSSDSGNVHLCCNAFI